MIGAEILSDSARGLIADLLLIAAVVSAVLIPALRWMQKTTHDIVRHELGPMTEAVKGHQRTLESIARNELSQIGRAHV